MAESKSVLVIGAGPAGLTAAYELSKSDIDVTILEQDAKLVGGISRTVNYKGFRFDIGGHRFFSKSQDVENLWTEILGDDMLTRGRMSRIFYDGKFYDYPLKAMNAFRNLGLTKTTLSVLDYLKAKAFPRPNTKSFEDWVINNFGERLYRTFFKTYTEKVWGMPCDEISADWAAQRIKGLSLWTAALNAVKPQSSSNRDTVIKTLIDQFRYPKHGPGMMWEKTAELVQQKGGDVLLGQKVSEVALKDGVIEHVRVTNNGVSTKFVADSYISSMPIRSLVRAITPSAPKYVSEAAESLKYRDFLTVALIIDESELFPDNWIYIHDPAVKVGRIQNFKNWSPYMVPNSSQSCLGLEYFCFEGDGLWTMDDTELIQLATKEVAKIGIVDPAKVTDGAVVRVPKAYPVYDDNYKSNVQLVLDYLQEHATNLQLVGRNGMHRYNNQDHAMMTGVLAAKNILGADYDLWSVNGDAEYLEQVSEERMTPRRLNSEVAATHEG